MLSHHDFLEECRAGMIEHRARQELPQLANSPYLDRPYVSYAEYMARKAQAAEEAMPS